MLKAFTILALCLFVFPQHVQAYIDPGTGSYLFQFVIAGALGGMYFFRGYIFKVKDKLTRGKKESGSSNEKSSKTTKGKK